MKARGSLMFRVKVVETLKRAGATPHIGSAWLMPNQVVTVYIEDNRWRATVHLPDAAEGEPTICDGWTAVGYSVLSFEHFWSGAKTIPDWSQDKPGLRLV